jgi:hypothetical protein
MNDESRKAKDRSPNFPFIPLTTAIGRAREFYNAEKRSAAPYAVAAKHWGYTATSSGGMQTMAALKSYGLMSDDGVGAQRMVRLSDLGLRIILDNRPDSIERDQFLRKAALNPSVAAQIYKKWPTGLPSDANLNHFLVLDLKFNDVTATKVVKIIKENEKLTATVSSDVESGPEDEAEDAYEEPAVEQQPCSQPITSPAPRSATVIYERIMAPGADIQIQFSGEPTFETYDFLEKYVALRKAILKKPPSE